MVRAQNRSDSGVPMDRSAAPACFVDDQPFSDGLGERRPIVGPNGRQSCELLCIRAELSAVPSFEFALRERLGRLSSFQHASYARALSVERVRDGEGSLGLVSERVEGIRLSVLITRAARRGLNLDINAAICLIRQLVAAVSALHSGWRDVAHGAVGPERIVVTQSARLILTEHALGSALEQLHYSQERYWRDLRIALPRSAGLPPFDHRADVTQLGATALALVLGRLIRDDEYPSKAADLVASVRAVSARGGFEALPPGLRSWMTRALQLDARQSFANAVEAQTDLERLLGAADVERERSGQRNSLESFLARYEAADAIDLFTTEIISPVLSTEGEGRASAVLDQFAEEALGQVPCVEAEPRASVRPPMPSRPVMTSPIPPSLRERQAILDAPELSRGHQTRSRWSRAAAVAVAAVLVAAGIPLTQRWISPTPAPPRLGTLSITTNPTAATAFIDGTPSGTTPLTIKLTPGWHTVELRGTGEPRSIPTLITAGAELAQYIELPTRASTPFTDGASDTPAAGADDKHSASESDLVPNVTVTVTDVGLR